MKRNTNVLVLGAEGMVGRVVFHYLHSFPNLHVWGTTRNNFSENKQLLFFEVNSFKKNFDHIKKQLKTIDYVINCIALTDHSSSIESLHTVNAAFPHELERLAEKENFNLIHISTDAVFHAIAGRVVETSKPAPGDDYGKSKLEGETTSQKALTFRSSFIGLDPISHRGLLESVLKQQNNVKGYINQIWTGCTSLQFAELIKNIIADNNFNKLRALSPLYQIAPLGPVSKYELIQTFLTAMNKTYHIRKTVGEKRERILLTKYPDAVKLDHYTRDLKKAIQELIIFEKSQN